MLSVSYVLVYVVAANWSLLNENVSWVRTLGILLVILGVILIVRSENRLDDAPLRDSPDS